MNQLYNPIIIRKSNFKQSTINFNTIKIKAESNDLRSLTSIKTKLNLLLDKNFITNMPPTKIKIYSPIKSPHVNKKSREQLGLTTYKKLFFIKDSESSNSKILKLIKLLNLSFPNISLTVTFQRLKKFLRG
jgi:ribosomal protein S10